jgi:hypothetical protein
LFLSTSAAPALDRRPHPRHTQEFLDEYQPQGPTEKQLVQELIDTSWRLNRVPSLEADVLSCATHPSTPEAAIEFDIVDAHLAIDKFAPTHTGYPARSTRPWIIFARSKPSPSQPSDPSE